MSLMICQTCQLPLDRYTDMSGVSYLHTPQDPDDHPVVPVPAPPSYAGGRCDFCNDTPPTHVLPARDFTTPHDPHHSSEGNWAACQVCAGLIERNEWARLTRRAIEGWQRRHGLVAAPAVRDSLSTLYRRLRKNITGALRPIAEVPREEP